MKYQIIVNQAGVVAAGLHLKTDLVDWAILSHIYAWQANSRATRDGDMVWISYSNIIAEMPLLGLNTKAAVSRRVRLLKELDLIQVRQAEDGRLFAKTTELYESVQEYRTRSPRLTGGVNDGEQGVFTKVNGALTEVNGDPLTTVNLYPKTISHPKTKSSGADAPATVPGLNTQAWERWIQFRKKHRFGAYKTNDTMLMLARYPFDVQAKAIQLSMDQRWQGVFPEKCGGEQSGNQQHRKDSALQQVETAFAGLEAGQGGLESGGDSVRHEVDQNPRRNSVG